MLEKPNIPDEVIVTCLREQFGVSVCSIQFLPLGADVDTAVYRAKSDEGSEYFVKLRRGPFDGVTVLLPHWLAHNGVSQVIPPIESRSGHLWAPVAEFNLVVYPFISGVDGFDRSLTREQWVSLGHALRQLHQAPVPEEITSRIGREVFGSTWRDEARRFQQRVEHEQFVDHAAEQLAEFMRAERSTISEIIGRAEDLCALVSARQHEFVVCHGDIHAGNIMVDIKGRLHVVDWDTVLLAPRERDLMYIGAGIGQVWNTAEEESMFYQGYGSVDPDREMLAYYRYERIVQDIVEFCRQLLDTDEGGEDREQSLYFFESQFFPGSVVEMACASDPMV